MSAGRFITAKYQTNDGEVHAIRIQPETLTLAIEGQINEEAAGSITGKGRAAVSKGKRQLGLRARMVICKWADPANAPTGYDGRGYIRLPWLTTSLFDDLAEGMDGTYLGRAIKVVNTSPQTYK